MTDIKFVTCPECGRVMVNELSEHTNWKGESCDGEGSLNAIVYDGHTLVETPNGVSISTPTNQVVFISRADDNGPIMGSLPKHVQRLVRCIMQYQNGE